jgi:hypothetical protein
MAIPSQAGGLPSARQQFMDRGENLDVSQVLSPGASVSAGQTWNNQLYGQGMAQDNVTATASGTQANSFKVLGPLVRVTTVVTAADSITLPPAIRGMEIAVLNDAAANSMNVFPASAAQGGVTGGDAINNGAANAAFAVAAQNGAGTGPTIFICYTNGFWRTK